MTDKKETKLDGFAKKGGLRRFTPGFLTNKIPALAAALVIGGAALAPNQAQAAPHHHRHSKGVATAAHVVNITAGGLQAVGSLSRMTAAFINRAEVKENVNNLVQDYNMQIQKLNAGYVAQVGTDPQNYDKNVEAYLGYRKNPTSMSEEQARALEQKLGKTGLSMVLLVEACEAFNARTALNANGRSAEAVEAEKQALALVREARKLDPKMTEIADSRYGLTKDRNGYFPATHQNINTVFNIATKRMNPRKKPVYEQWGIAYEQAGQKTRIEYQKMLNKQLGAMRGYDAQIGNEIFRTSFHAWQITGSAMRLNHIHNHRHRR